MRRTGIFSPRKPTVGLPGPIWPPTNLPGLGAWYDMLEVFGESAGAMTSIRNMVTGSDLMAQGNATNQPAYEATGLNGLPCFKADGAGDHMLSTEASVMALLGNTTAPVTFAYVIDLVTPNRSSAVFGAGNSGVANASFWSVGTSTPNGGQHILNVEGDVTGISPFARSNTAFAGPQAVVWTSTAGEVTVYVNGKAVGMTSRSIALSEVITLNRFGLCTRPDSAPDTFFDGRFGCLLLYGRGLPRAEALGLSFGMMGRWRIPT
jgi:hypothetical protein